MDNKAITRRLDALQQLVNRNKPCEVVVTLTNGEIITTDPAGAIELCKERELGEIESITTERPDYIGLICTLNTVYGGEN